MAKSCVYTILAPGGNLTTTAQSDIYRYAVVVSLGDWAVRSLHRDMRAAMGIARSMMNKDCRAKVVEAVLVDDGGVLKLGAVEQRMQEKVDRLRANSLRTYGRIMANQKDAEKHSVLCKDFKAYERWIDEIKSQIKAV